MYFFLKSHHKIFEAGLIYKAFSDYMNNKWGKLYINDVAQNKEHQSAYRTSSNKKEQLKKILISSNGIPHQECITVYKSLNSKYPEAEIMILIHDDRNEYFKEYRTHILNRAKINNLFYLIKESIAIKRQKFDAIVSVIPTPFMYLGKSSILFNKDGEILSKTDTSLFSLIKLALLVCYSEIAVVIALPFLLYKSLQYKNINH
jgi:hypothetical protein